MADELEDSQAFKEITPEFIEAYDRERALLMKRGPLQCDNIRKNIASIATMSYRSFKALANLKVDDGANVPCIMAALQSQTLAALCMEELFNYNGNPAALTAKFAEIIFDHVSGPLHQVYWDKLVQESFEKFNPPE